MGTGLFRRRKRGTGKKETIGEFATKEKEEERWSLLRQHSKTIDPR